MTGLLARRRPPDVFSAQRPRDIPVAYQQFTSGGSLSWSPCTIPIRFDSRSPIRGTGTRL
eukprot:scaffold31036_cov42-Attheya_sp.AAC.2